MRPGRALFFGNALGILPFLLTDLFGSVVLSDRDTRRLALARHREADESVRNLTCVFAESIDDLVARREGTFDLVVLGEERPDAPVSVPLADSRTASRVASLVAAEGCLTYGVRFPLLWPLAKRYPAHARMLAAAGFASVTAYARRPARRPYQMYLPLNRPDVIAYWVRNGPRSRGLRARLTGAVKGAAIRLDRASYLFDNFLMIARRG